MPKMRLGWYAGVRTQRNQPPLQHDYASPSRYMLTKILGLYGRDWRCNHLSIPATREFLFIYGLSCSEQLLPACKDVSRPLLSLSKGKHHLLSDRRKRHL